MNKYRNKYGMFMIEGPKMMEEILDSPYEINSIFATKEWIDQYKKIAKRKVQVVEVQESELKKISNLQTPNQVLATVKIPETTDDLGIKINDLTLALDQINDPGNLGTIVRIADWFGIRQIICSENTVDVYNPKVIQATMGSIARVQIHYTNLFDFISGQNANVPVYATTLNGENIYQSELKSKSILLIGNESRGIDEQLLWIATKKISIPFFPETKKSAESLNAGVAAGILCAEFRRTSK